MFIQPASNYKAIHNITERMQEKEMRKVTKEQVVMGSLLAAPYFDDFYRALIVSSSFGLS